MTRAEQVAWLRSEMARVENEAMAAAHRLLNAAAATRDWPPASPAFQARAREQAVASLLAAHTELVALDASLLMDGAA